LVSLPIDTSRTSQNDEKEGCLGPHMGRGDNKGIRTGRRITKNNPPKSRELWQGKGLELQ
jgi:hypothetical protein